MFKSSLKNIPMYATIFYWLSQISAWLERTQMNQAIQVHDWIVPIVQSIHILGIAVVASSALMINLRLVGLYAADQPLKEVLARFLPFHLVAARRPAPDGHRHDRRRATAIAEESGVPDQDGAALRRARGNRDLPGHAAAPSGLRRSHNRPPRGRRNAREHLDAALGGIIFAGRWIAYYY